MKISVIIPAYNASKTIIDAVKSVVNQTFAADFEIIVVDDGSSDDTYLKVLEYRCGRAGISIKLIHQENKGVAAARNQGMKNSSGDWIAFLDSDDIWKSNKIARQFDCILQNPEIDFIGCDVDSNITRILGRKKNGLSRISLKEQFIKGYPHTPTYLFKREILDKSGLMDENMRYGEDSDFLLRILPISSAWFLAESLVQCGHGKKFFGDSGLSANLKKMQEGQRIVLSRAFKRKQLNSLEYLLAKMFSELKYLRRILISITRRKNKKIK